MLVDKSAQWSPLGSLPFVKISDYTFYDHYSVLDQIGKLNIKFFNYCSCEYKNVFNHLSLFQISFLEGSLNLTTSGDVYTDLHDVTTTNLTCFFSPRNANVLFARWYKIRPNKEELVRNSDFSVFNNFLMEYKVILSPFLFRFMTIYPANHVGRR